MKTVIKASVLGTLTADIHKDGIVLFESKSKGFFDKQPFTFKARIDPQSAEARVIHLTTALNHKTLQEHIAKMLPPIWQTHLAAHPSIKFIADRREIDTARNKSIEELRSIIERMEVQITHAKTLLQEL